MPRIMPLSLFALLVASNPSVVCAEPHSTPDASRILLSPASVGCKAAAWSPEVISFFGDRKTVTDKVDRAQADLPNRRLFIVVVETATGADVSLYEQLTDHKAKVWRWRSDSAATAHAAIRQAILENKGQNCVGEQSREALLKALGSPQTPNPEAGASPASLRATTEHPLKEAKGEYVGATFYLLC